jgi:hypothetical protein
MSFVGGKITYLPGGLWHAVDPNSVPHDREAVLAYARCGAAVRIWRDESFDPSYVYAHKGCAG